MKRLDNKEKVAYGKMAAHWFLKGQNEKEITAKLKADGIMDFDIKKVLKSAKMQAMELEQEKIEKYLLADTLASKKSDFDWLSEQELNELQIKARNNIIRKTNAKVSELYRAGMDEDEIYTRVRNRFYGRNAVIDQIESYRYMNEPVDSMKMGNYLIIGIGSILLGLILSIYGDKGSGVTIYYGLVIFGIIYSSRAFMTRQEIDKRKKERNSKFGIFR